MKPTGFCFFFPGQLHGHVSVLQRGITFNDWKTPQVQETHRKRVPAENRHLKCVYEMFGVFNLIFNHWSFHVYAQ